MVLSPNVLCGHEELIEVCSECEREDRQPWVGPAEVTVGVAKREGTWPVCLDPTFPPNPIL